MSLIALPRATFLKLEYIALGIPEVAPPATGRGAALQIANHLLAKRNQLLTAASIS